MLENISHLQKICIPKMCIIKAELVAEAGAQRVQRCPVQARAHKCCIPKGAGNKQGEKIASRGPWRMFQGLTESEGGVVVEQLPGASGGCQSWSHGRQQGFAACWVTLLAVCDLEPRLPEETTPPGPGCPGSAQP